MKTIQEIKSEMTAAILANATLVEAMELDISRTWEEQTSVASVLNVLLYIVATSWYALQWMMEQFKKDVEKRILAALPGTVSWYWNRAMAFQRGYPINDAGGYDVIDTDPAVRIVRYCAVVDAFQGVLIKINGVNHEVIEGDDLTAFEAYINAVKFAGCRVAVSSLAPDQIWINIALKTNPLILKPNGRTVVGDTNVVRHAIINYLASIAYGGMFNKTKLVDAIQAVEGVEDVILKGVRTKDATVGSTFRQLSNTNNYTATSGSIELYRLDIEDYQ